MTTQTGVPVDENYIPVLFAVDSTDDTKIVPLQALATGELKIELV